MNIWMLNAGLIFILIVVLVVFAFIKAQKLAEIRKRHPGYPKGYWMNQGIAMGVAIGTGVGVAIKNIAIGVAIGVAIGAAIGTSWEKKHKDEIRPITEEEKALQRQTRLFTAGLLILGIIVFLVVYFATKQ